jgi:hypothetical protein
VRRDPHRSRERLRLAGALGIRAETLLRLGRHADALLDYEEIVELIRGEKEREIFRAFQGLTKARLGDLSVLAHLADEVRETLKLGAGPDNSLTYGFWMNCYDAACIHAALAKWALQDRERPPAERQRLAQQDLDQALDLLDRARAVGEFTGQIPLDEIRRESLLDPLRPHPRFQLLMLDLAFPEGPFGP